MTYIFDHIFKTAGTTFNLSYVLAAFEPEERFVLNGHWGSNQEDLTRLRDLPLEQRQRLKIIAGHNTGALRPDYPDAAFISVVRDPIERAISGYLHAKFHGDAWELAGREIQERNMGLAEFIEEDLFARRYAPFVSVHNWQARTLLGPVFDEPPLDHATITRTIRSRFHLVGYTESLELFLFYLHVTAGFPLLLFNNRLVRKERSSFQPTADDLAAIERYNRIDQEVYLCARQEFDRRAAEIWTDELARRYREYTEALQQFRSDTRGEVNAHALFECDGSHRFGGQAKVPADLSFQPAKNRPGQPSEIPDDPVSIL